MRIFTYIDRSPFAASVCQHAVWAATQLNAGIELVHVLDHPAIADEHDYSGYMSFDASETALEERIQLDEAHNRLLIDEGRALLDSVADRIRETGIQSVSQRLYQDSVVEHFAEHAQDAVLVVVGKRGEGASRDPQHLGRNIERLVRSARKPILIAGEDFAPIASATIAWDGGKSSGEAVHFLANNPLLKGIDTTLFHITDGGRVPMALNDARSHLEGAGLRVSVETESGDVTETILSHTSGHASDLLVIGAYGHARIRHLVVGSTTTEILMRAESSVLVFH